MHKQLRCSPCRYNIIAWLFENTQLCGFFVYGSMYEGLGKRACTMSSAEAGFCLYYILSNNGIPTMELLLHSESVTVSHEVITVMGKNGNILHACFPWIWHLILSHIYVVKKTHLKFKDQMNRKKNSLILKF